MAKEPCPSGREDCPHVGNGEAYQENRSDSQTDRSPVCEAARRKNVYGKLLGIAICLLLMQCLLLGVKQLVFCYAVETLYSRSMVTMLCMVILLAGTVLYGRCKKLDFSVFPRRFGVYYIAVTVLAAGFYLYTLLVVKTFSMQAALMLFYGSIVTPVFEELLFRGGIWNSLRNCFSKEWKTYLVVTLLFALWHIGYAVGIYLWSGGNLLSCIAMKVLAGASFGLLTGAIRWKTKNCYGGILLHGVLNAIG